jgi:hypothetical protein
MGRFKQAKAEHGSQKWIQLGVNSEPPLLNKVVSAKLAGPKAVTWQSPTACDEYAEYRDHDFLERIGQGRLTSELQRFWPIGGPQWDALATSDDGSVLLVEGKSHIGELCSSPSQASAASRKKIDAALRETASHIAAKPLVPWTDGFYQLANRLAHLHFLRENGVKAWLVLINFVGDADVQGTEWRAAYQVVWHVLGVRKDHRLSPFTVDIYPDVRSTEWTALDVKARSAQENTSNVALK